MVGTLLGNIAARINVRRQLAKSIKLSRSIGQGCLLALLMYASIADGMNWITHTKMEMG